MSAQPTEEVQRQYVVQRFFDLHPQQMPTRNMYIIYDLCQSKDLHESERGMRIFGDMMRGPKRESVEDQFAVQAFGPILAFKISQFGHPCQQVYEDAAREAKQAATAMMKERAK